MTDEELLTIKLPNGYRWLKDTGNACVCGQNPAIATLALDGQSRVTYGIAIRNKHVTSDKGVDTVVQPTENDIKAEINNGVKILKEHG